MVSDINIQLFIQKFKFLHRLFTGCCCFIPCLMDAFHDYAHQCPNCNGIIGKSTPDEREEERKKGLKVVIGTIICYACVIIVLLVIYFSLIFAYI